MRLAALQSVVNAGPEGSSGCLRPPRRRGFPRVPAAPRPASSPAPLRDRVHPLVSFASSSEYEPLRICPAHGCAERLPWGLVPNRGISCGDPLASEVPPSPYGPPPAFRTPSTAFALHCLVGLFHPTTTSGIHLSGGFPAAQPGHLVGGSCPPVVAHRSLSRVASRRQHRWPRLQGLDPGGDPSSTTRQLAASKPDPLLGFCSLGFSSHLGGAFTPPPLAAFVSRACV
jgi:hypothetical protein